MIGTVVLLFLLRTWFIQVHTEKCWNSTQYQIQDTGVFGNGVTPQYGVLPHWELVVQHFLYLIYGMKLVQ
jgi:hypothetical protein